MSVLIKGMKMPKDGERLKVWIEANGQVIVDKRTYYEEYEAVELPDHGDLIERDELMKHAVYMPMDGGNLPLVYMSYVKSAKAIIPAERSEDGET